MAEWLTHVLIAYALFTAACWTVGWLDERWVAVGMVGSVLPDLNRLALLVPTGSVSVALGVPFDWRGLHTLAGAFLLAGLGAVLFDSARRRRRAFVVLAAGAVSHVAVDVPQRYADGLTITNVYLFPFSSVRVPSPGWYVSADRWVLPVATAVALLVFLADRYRGGSDPEHAGR